MTYLRNQPYDEKEFPVFAAIREQFGFLPNFFPAQTARPDLINAEVALTGNLQEVVSRYPETRHSVIKNAERYHRTARCCAETLRRC
jgi:hypothetical protein